VSLGAELQNLKEFTAAFPADLKGASLSNSEVIRKAHNRRVARGAARAARPSGVSARG